MRLGFGLLIATLAFAPLSHAADKEDGEAEVQEFLQDIILLKSGEGIEGHVTARTKRAIKILVAEGTFWIPLSAVKRIEFNIESRLRELKKNDYKGRYELAKQALEMGQAQKAKEILKSIADKPGLDPEMYRMLARLHDEAEEYKEALQNWERYLVAHPKDAEAIDRIAELSKVVRPVKEEVVAVKEGLEAKKWQPLTWGNKTSLSTQVVNSNKLLAVSVEGGEKDKGPFSNAGRYDFSKKGNLLFDVYNYQKTPISIAVALIDNKNEYYESRTIRVMHGWNIDQMMDVKKTNWKTKTSNWRHTAEVKNINDIRQIIFLVYNGRSKSMLSFNNIRVE